MSKLISICLFIPDTTLASWIRTQVESLVDVRIVQGEWSADKSGPEILIVGEGEREASIVALLQKLKRRFPTTAIVLISTIRDPQHIVAAMKAGAAEYLIPPLSTASFKQTIDELRVKLAADTSTLTTPAPAGQVYSFMSSKGGLGATVISVNTAVALAERQKNRVALVDMSLQSGDSSTLLDLMPHLSITDLCKNFHRLDAAFLQRAMTRHESGISFLPAPKNPEENLIIKPDQVKSILQLVKGNFDTIVVDCISMSINNCSMEVFHLSDKVFVLSDLSVPAIRNCSKLMELIRKRGVPSDKVEIAVNRYIRGKAVKISDVEESLKKPIYWFFPNDFQSTIASINMGVPLVKYQPRTALAKNIREFIRKLENPGDLKDYRGLRGFFGRSV